MVLQYRGVILTIKYEGGTKEYELLCLLATNQGQVLTYTQIYEKVFQWELLSVQNTQIQC